MPMWRPMICMVKTKRTAAKFCKITVCCCGVSTWPHFGLVHVLSPLSPTLSFFMLEEILQLEYEMWGFDLAVWFGSPWWRWPKEAVWCCGPCLSPNFASVDILSPLGETLYAPYGTWRSESPTLVWVILVAWVQVGSLVLLVVCMTTWGIRA